MREDNMVVDNTLWVGGELGITIVLEISIVVVVTKVVNNKVVVDSRALLIIGWRSGSRGA